MGKRIYNADRWGGFSLGCHAIVFLLLSGNLRAGEPVPYWPQFRGPGGKAIAGDQSIPLEFGPDKNVLWKTPVPMGHSSPCVWGDRVFLTGHDGVLLKMVCLQRSDGNLLWVHERKIDKVPAYEHIDGDPAVPTPATDGERVVFYFDDYGLIVTSLDGELQWEEKMAPTGNPFGYGASPLIDDGRIYLNRDGVLDSGLACFSLESGEELWRAKRPDAYFSFCTPYLLEDQGQKQVLAGGTGALNAYDAQSGKPVWNVSGLPFFICPSPVDSEGMIFFGGWTTAHVSGRNRIDASFDEESGISEEARKDPKVFFADYDTDKDGRLVVDEFPPSRTRDAFNFVDKNKNGFVEFEEFAPMYEEKTRVPGRNVLYGIAGGGKGDVTGTHVKWETTKALPYVCSPLVYRGRLYLLRNGGFFTCLNPENGDVIYRERLGAGGEYYATPVAVGDYLVLCAKRGTAMVVRVGDQLDIVSRNEMGEGLYATPVVVENTLYLRGDQHLWAFSNQ